MATIFDVKNSKIAISDFDIDFIFCVKNYIIFPKFIQKYITTTDDCFLHYTLYELTIILL